MYNSVPSHIPLAVAETASVATTNVASEKDFAVLDHVKSLMDVLIYDPLLPASLADFVATPTTSSLRLEQKK